MQQVFMTAVIKENVQQLFMTVSCYSCQILMTFELYGLFLKNTQISNFIKIFPAGAELFHVDRRTGRYT
jgi:hypothetical protein